MRVSDNMECLHLHVTLWLRTLSQRVGLAGMEVPVNGAVGTVYHRSMLSQVSTRPWTNSHWWPGLVEAKLSTP